MSNQKTSWLNSKIGVRGSSTHGQGTFAIADIKKSEVVIVQGGVMITEQDFDKPEFSPYGYHCFQVEREIYICPITPDRSHLDGILLVNHSCEPTCGIRGQISMIAMRNIHAGEEITFDYAMTDVGSHELGWTDMKCNCESASCRRVVTGQDWKLPELQQKYKGYFSRYVEDLIAASEQ